MVLDQDMQNIEGVQQAVRTSRDKLDEYILKTFNSVHDDFYSNPLKKYSLPSNISNEAGVFNLSSYKKYLENKLDDIENNPKGFLDEVVKKSKDLPEKRKSIIHKTFAGESSSHKLKKSFLASSAVTTTVFFFAVSNPQVVQFLANIPAHVLSIAIQGTAVAGAAIATGTLINNYLLDKHLEKGGERIANVENIDKIKEKLVEKILSSPNAQKTINRLNHAGYIPEIIIVHPKSLIAEPQRECNDRFFGCCIGAVVDSRLVDNAHILVSNQVLDISKFLPERTVESTLLEELTHFENLIIDNKFNDKSYHDSYQKDISTEGGRDFFNKVIRYFKSEGLEFYKDPKAISSEIIMAATRYYQDHLLEEKGLCKEEALKAFNDNIPNFAKEFRKYIEREERAFSQTMEEKLDVLRRYNLGPVSQLPEKAQILQEQPDRKIESLEPPIKAKSLAVRIIEGISQ